jgi:hypothetical protein
LKSHQDRRLKDLLAEGEAALEESRADRAADLFGRALLMSPQDAEAQRGVEKARAAVEEQQRLREAQVAEAESALARGAFTEATRIVEALRTQGADDDRVQGLQDRLDGRSGRVTQASVGSPFPWPAEAPASSRSRTAWSRLVMAAGWAAGLSVLATGVASSWESLVVRLERTPMPQAAQAGVPTTVVPQTTRGERLLVDARRLLDAGDAAAALATLDQVVPEEPAYPLARKLRDEAELLQRAGGRRR